MKTINLILLLSISHFLRAQSLTTVSQSNLSGVYTSLLNPATAGGIDRANINFTSFGATINNNSLRSSLKYSIAEIVTLRAMYEREVEHSPPYFNAPRKWAKNPNLYMNFDALHFGGQFAFNKKISVHGFARERAIINLDKTDYSSLKYVVEADFIPAEPLSLQFDLRSIAFQELGIGGSVQLFSRDEHYLKMGFTYKWLYGRSAYAMNVPTFDTDYDDNSVNLNAEFNVIETSLDFITQNPFDFIVKPSIGTGRSLDFGFVYEHRPRRMILTYRKHQPKKKNHFFNARNLIKYKYRIGASIIDLGSISFNSNEVSNRTYIAKASFNPLHLVGMDQEDYFNAIRDSSHLVDSGNYINYSLPTTLSFQGDFRFHNDWFASTLINVPINNNELGMIRNPMFIQFQMRKETERCVFGFPLSIMPRTRTYTLGAYAQTGPVFIGTNNLSTLLFRRMYNPSFFAGIQWNIRYRKDPTIENYNSFR